MYATDAGNKYAGNRIEFRLDKPTGPIIGHVVSQSTGGWNKFVTASGIVSGVTGGVHDLYITCSPPSTLGRPLPCTRSGSPTRRALPSPANWSRRRPRAARST